MRSAICACWVIRTAKDKAGGPNVEAVRDDDLPEVEEENSVPDDAFATVVKDLDEPVVLSNTVEYKECPPTVPYRRDLLGLSVTEIARISLDVVEAERADSY